MMFKNDKSAAKRPMRRLIPRKTLHARAATNAKEVDDYDSEAEPGMKLSHAFIVVLILHVVAVGGIYGFNKLQERSTASTAKKEIAAPAAPQTPSAQTVAAAQAKPEAVPQTYSVVGGDTLRRISSKFKTSIEALEKANNLTSTSILKVGQVLIVGSTAKSSSPSSTLPSAKTASTPALVAKAPPVKLPEAKTESQKKLQIKPQAAPPKTDAKATASATTQTEVAKASPVKLPEAKTESQNKPQTNSQAATTKIEAKPTAPATTQAESGKVHVVAKGENPFSIAKKYNTTQAALMKANNIADPRSLQIGQKLVLP